MRDRSKMSQSFLGYMDDKTHIVLLGIRHS